MKKLMFSLLVAAAPVVANDEFQVVYSCHSPGIVDGGYVVTIETGGFAGITQARLAQDSIVGARPVQNFIVKSSASGKQTVFEGKNFRMVVGPGGFSPNIGIPHKTYKATFMAKVKNVEHHGDLTCWSPKDPQ